MQDIGQYAEDQIQGLFRGSQWRMYNEMLREASAFQLTHLHQKRQETESEQDVMMATRQKELDVLEELNQLMIYGREEAKREREEAVRNEQKKEVKTLAKKETKLTLSELQRATGIMTKVEHAMAKLARRGHRFSEYDAPGRTVLDLVLEQLQHTRLMGENAAASKEDSARKLEAANATLEAAEAELSRIAFPIETPEPDVADLVDGQLSPRARGVGFNIRDMQKREQDVQRRISARLLMLPQMEDRAAKVTGWFGRVTPKLEGFEAYQQVFVASEKMATTPAGEVLRWLKCMDATLSWVKTEVGTIRKDTGMPELDWNDFQERGLAALEEGKVVCVDESRNTRVLTEEEETMRLREYRRRQVELNQRAVIEAQKGAPVSGAGGKLEEIRAAADAKELQERISVALEREERMDTMGETEANAYSRDRVRIAHDGHKDELRQLEHEREKREKEQRRRSRKI